MRDVIVQLLKQTLFVAVWIWFQFYGFFVLFLGMHNVVIEIKPPLLKFTDPDGDFLFLFRINDCHRLHLMGNVERKNWKKITWDSVNGTIVKGLHLEALSDLLFQNLRSVSRFTYFPHGNFTGLINNSAVSGSISSSGYV